MTDDLPKTMILKPTFLGSGVPLFLGLLILNGALLMTSSYELEFFKWVMIGVVGFNLLSLALLLLYPSRLTLNNDGFKQRVFGRNIKYKWNEVLEFEVVKTPFFMEFVAISKHDEKENFFTNIPPPIIRSTRLSIVRDIQT